ncbi:MAG: lysophospholipid acyltransferase family protein [Verrucomicrobiota bacterium]
MSEDLNKNPFFYKIIVSICRCYFRSCHSFRVLGADHIPSTGGGLFVSNHCAFFDPPAMACATPRMLDFLARKTLFSNPVFGKAIHNLNAIPIDQENPDMAGLKTIISRLRQGRIVVLYPEGARSWDGALQPAQPGTGLVIEKAGVPVIPSRFFGMHEAWPRGDNPRLFKPITLVVGEPFVPQSNRTDKRERYQELSNQVMQAIAAIRAPTSAGV